MSFSVATVRFGRAALLCAGLGMAAACGGDPSIQAGGSDTDGATDTVVPTPSVVGVPAIWHAGDLIKVAGTNFLTPTDGGSVTLRFVGTFAATDGGSSESVDWEFQATQQQANRVDFTFEPDEAPSGFGTYIGTFSGKVTATNTSKAGKEAASQATSVSVTVGPSIVIQAFYPQGSSCDANRVTDTLKTSVMTLSYDVIGMGASSSYTPITMNITWSDINDETQVLTKSITSGTGGSAQIDTGTPSALDDADGNDASTLDSDIGISLKATDGDGNTISRRVVVTVHEQYSVVYNGETSVVEVYTPQVVTGCLPGGQTGASFNYSESSSEGRSRGYSLSASVGIDVWVLNLGFGFSVNESVSSSSGIGSGISHSVFPHWYGAFYRQTSKLRRTGQVVQWDDCGASAQIGEAYVTDWVWAPGFNQESTDCPPLPDPLMSDTGTLEMSN